MLLLGLAAGALIARQIAGPLRRLDDAAERVKEGDLSARAKVEGSEEQRSLATTFNQMTARLERLVEGQREFVADASHQLRTPLSGLRLRLEEARAVARDRDAEEEIDGALVEVDRLAAMVTELLLLSQAGEADAPAERVDLADAARRAAERFPERRQHRQRPARAAGARRAGRPRPRARRPDRERAPLRRRQGRRSSRGPAPIDVLDEARASTPPSSSRSSSASTAAGGPRRPAGHRPRPPDRARADAALGRRRPPRQPRRRRRRGDRRAALGRGLTRPGLPSFP